MFATTRLRVRRRSPRRATRAIDEHIRERVQPYVTADRLAIDTRLRALDREWDIERVLEANFAAVVLLGCGLGRFVHPNWTLLPITAAGFMVQHVFQGWCPPLPVLRRAGVRTADEINRERVALKILRGDFNFLRTSDNAKPDVAQIVSALNHR